MHAHGSSREGTGKGATGCRPQPVFSTCPLAFCCAPSNGNCPTSRGRGAKKCHITPCFQYFRSVCFDLCWCRCRCVFFFLLYNGVFNISATMFCCYFFATAGSLFCCFFRGRCFSTSTISCEWRPFCCAAEVDGNNFRKKTYTYRYNVSR